MLNYLIWDLKQLMISLNRSAVLSRLLRTTDRGLLGAVAIMLTNRCNLRCHMCSLLRTGQHDEYKRQHLRQDVEVARATLHELSRMRPLKPRVHWTGGGEPLLHKHCSTLFEECERLGLTWSLTTNGVLLGSHIDEILSGRCDRINVSLHGNEPFHDAIVDVPGAFAKVVGNLEVLAREKARRRKVHPVVAINCVMGKRNLHHLDTILDELQRLPAHSITFQHLVFSEKDLTEGSEILPAHPEETEVLRAFVQRTKRQHTRVPVQFFPEIKPADIGAYYSDWNHPFRETCTFPWLALIVHAQGDIVTCTEQPLGNLARDSIAEIWNGEAHRRFRREVIAARILAGCKRCCQRIYY